MKVTYHDVDQRSPEWQALRLGRLTASRAGDMAATIKTGEAAARRNLRVQLVLERLTNRSHDRGYLSGPMQDGIDREPIAIARYMAHSAMVVEPVGFIACDDLMVGCSPDGFVGDGFVSIKCPTPAIHLEYMRTGEVPRDYFLQIVHEVWLSGREWCDFVSFQPDFPEPLQLKVVRVVVGASAVQAYAEKALAFLQEVDTEVAAVRTMVDTADVLRASGAVA